MFVDVPAPHGRLEAVYWQVEAPVAAAVVLHPHPQLGGTMHHHAPYRLARALRESAITNLRFNFRGVGRSTGSYGEGLGEVDDVRAGLDFLASRAPGLPLWIAGFSFGAWVGLRATSEDARVEAALVAGVPVAMFDHGFVAQVRAPIAAIQGANDQFGGIDEVERVLRTAQGPVRVTALPDADHMFAGQLDAFESAAVEAIAFLRAAAGAAPR